MMVAEVKPKVPSVTEAGGITSVTVTGADGKCYTWNGSGSVHLTKTVQQEPGSKKMRDVEYIEVLLVPDPTKHNAKLPVRAATVTETPEGE